MGGIFSTLASTKTLSNSRWRNGFAVAALLLVSVALLHSYRSAISAPSVTPFRWEDTLALSEHPGDEIFFNIDTDDFDLLHQLNLTDVPSFRYRRQCIVARPRHDRHASLAEQLNFALPAQKSAVNIKISSEQLEDSRDRTLLPPCKSSFTIDVPETETPARGDASALMLGMSTTLSRIEDSLPSFSRWLSHRQSPLIVVLNDQQYLRPIASTLERITRQAEALGIEILFEPYKGQLDDVMGAKNFAIAAAFRKHQRPDTRWFGIVDDDTFFLSLSRMMQTLDSYDSSQPWYLGTLSEDHDRLDKDGYMAYGGGGIFISHPLMREIYDSKHCLALERGAGDVRWRDCIFDITSPTVPLTVLPGLNQMDLWGDASGWWEGPHHHKILTMHHWKSWYTFPLPEAHLIVDIVGIEGFLQRYTRGRTVLTNGYSIVEYPRGLPDLNLVELTMVPDVNLFEVPDWKVFHHSLGRTRPALAIGEEKLSWTLERAFKTPNGTVRQFYIRRGHDDPLDVDIIEIDWQRCIDCEE